MSTLDDKMKGWLENISTAYKGEDVRGSIYNSIKTIHEVKMEGVQISKDSADKAEAYAVGTVGGTAVTSSNVAYNNNAKYYAEKAGEIHNELSEGLEYIQQKQPEVDAEYADFVTSKDAITQIYTDVSQMKDYVEQNYSDVEGWTYGTKGGVALPNSDPLYNNNSKYFYDESKKYKEESYRSATIADDCYRRAGMHAEAARQSALEAKEAPAIADNVLNTIESSKNTTIQNADRAAQLVNTIDNKIATGYFKGEKGDQGVKGDKGDKGDQGIQGEQGPRGDSGVTALTNGFFTLSVDENGDLYAYAETDLDDMFEYDSQTGALYYITEED